jgi:hypothetical protein
MATSKVTVDHDEIRRWVESRGGYPARVKGTGRPGDAGLLRIDYPGFRGEDTLERIGWADWFDTFEENNLALVRSEDPRNRFAKLVSRDTVQLPRARARGRVSQARRREGGRVGRAASASRGSATKRTAAKKVTKTKRAAARPAAPKRRTTTRAKIVRAGRVTPKRAAPKKRRKRTASKKRATSGSSRLSPRVR